jgi:hypothetical protein
MHHASFTSLDFQESWRREPHPFCADCHAPGRSTLGAVAEHRGVGCDSCHVVPVGHGTAERSKTASLSCAPCHDFPVPNSRAFLQSTAREHAQSSFAGTSCTECHMPLQNGKRNHAFFSSRNLQVLRQSIEVSAVVATESEVQVTMRSVGVGHRFPTGDIFRRLSVSIVASNASGQIVCAETTHFNRNWGAHHASVVSGSEERIESDNRLTDAPRILRAACSGAPRDVQVTVDYARGKAADENAFAAFETVQLLDAHYPVGAAR